MTHPAHLWICIFEYIFVPFHRAAVYIRLVQVDRQKVLSHGRSVSGKLLVELQTRKSTADGAGAKKFYNDLTAPLPGWDSHIRDLVVSKRQVRHPDI